MMTTDAPKTFQEKLGHIAQDPRLSARLVNTLSYLEYIGARKILKSQPAESLSHSMLTHAAEEIRHAKILKSVALGMSDLTLEGYALAELLQGSFAGLYFQTLDRGIAQILSNASILNYLYTTLLVEERAVTLYTQIAEIFPQPALRKAIDGILSEEDRHLSDMREELELRDSNFTSRHKNFSMLEHSAFRLWTDQLDIK